MPRRDPTELASENAQVLNLVQALLGSVSANMRAVSLECSAQGVRLNFLLAHDDSRDREGIEDVVFEVEAMQAGPLDVRVSVQVSASAAVGRLPGRLVYARKEPANHDETEPGPTES